MNHENSKYSMRIGNTTYIVCVKQSETAVKPLETAFRDICKYEVLNGKSGADENSLEKISKSS